MNVGVDDFFHGNFNSMPRTGLLLFVVLFRESLYFSDVVVRLNQGALSIRRGQGGLARIFLSDEVVDTLLWRGCRERVH